VGEIPHEKALVERFKNAPFAILGVNTDDSKDDFKKKIAEHGVTWQNIFAGSTEKGVPADWGITGYPTTFLIDADGYIRHRDLHIDDVAAEVRKLLMEMDD